MLLGFTGFDKQHCFHKLVAMGTVKKYSTSAKNDPDANATSATDWEHYDVAQSPFLEIHTPFTTWWVFGDHAGLYSLLISMACSKP